MALFGALYFFAYHQMDIDKISGYSALPSVPADELPHDVSILSTILKPSAQYHQRLLAKQTAESLLGIWVLDEFDKFGLIVPKMVEFRRVSPDRISVHPRITSENQQVGELQITRWISSDFPTAVHTGTPININLFSYDKIGIETSAMDPFGLGAGYTRKIEKSK